MDPSAFLEVEFEDDIEEQVAGMGDLTEDDIILLDNDYEEMTATHSAGSKRPPPATEAVPSSKKIKKTLPALAPVSKVMMNSKLPNKNPHSPHPVKTVCSPTGSNMKTSHNLTVTAKSSPAPVLKPKMQQSITWKYRPLGENQYTVDIRKSDMLRDYEPEQCSCKKPEEGQSPCGSGCINRSTYSECEPGMCINGEQCSNMVIQRRQYAPGLERFMTSKKGWGVRARQSIAKNSFILEYTGEICSKEEFERRMLVRYKIDNHHYCLAMDNKIMIDAHRAGSECRFVNHACSPNCEMQKWTVRGLPRMGLFALKDILPGEEICYDYNFSLFNTDQGQECKCGAKDCRGIIGGKNKDFLITLDGEDEANKAEEKVKPKPPQVKPVISQRILDEEKWFAEKVDQEDMEWIEKNAPKPAQLEAKTLKCTVCNEHLDFKVQSQCQKHPDLGKGRRPTELMMIKVLLCQECCCAASVGVSTAGGAGTRTRRATTSSAGETELRVSDGLFVTFLSFRWCSEGGQIYLCDFCSHAFCNKCIRWNLGRKYLKAVEEDEKWKCLICDPSYLRDQRAIYWAILKYHKERKAKLANSSSTPIRGNKAQPQVNSSPKAKVQTNGIKANGLKSFSPSQKPNSNIDTIRNVYNKLQSNSDVTVSPVSKNSLAHCNNIKRNGSQHEEPKHFVDSCLMDVDDCVQQMVYMLGEVKKAWKLSGKRSRDAMVVTSKLRKALELAKHNIDEVDKKVVKGTNSETKESPSKEKNTVQAKPAKVSLVSPTRPPLNPAVTGVSVDSEEGIHDVSVDELEVDAKPCRVKNSQTEVKVENSTEDIVTGEVNGSIRDEINTEKISEEKPLESLKDKDALIAPKQECKEEKKEESSENISPDRTLPNGNLKNSPSRV